LSSCLPITTWPARRRSVSPTSRTSTCCRTPPPFPSGVTLRPNCATAAPTAPYYRSVEEKLEHVAAGHGVIVLPLSTATCYTRGDITHIGIEDIAPNQVCLAWESARHNPLIGEFVAIATSDLPERSRAGDPL
jgi:hypothetical protein